MKDTRAVGAGAGRLLAVRLVRCAPIEAGGCGKLDRQEIRSTGPATKGYVQERALRSGGSGGATESRKRPAVVLTSRRSAISYAIS